MNGIDIAQQIRMEFPHLRCLMLSGHISSKYVKRSLEVGACGYILKEDVDGILEGIRRALDGGIYVSQALQSEE